MFWSFFIFLSLSFAVGDSHQILENHSPRFITIDPKSLVDKCQFVGYQCPSLVQFEQGLCTDCGSDGSKCALLSTSIADEQKLDWKPSHNHLNGNYYLALHDKAPYCLHLYGIEIYLNNATIPPFSKFILDLEGTREKVYGISILDNFAYSEYERKFTFLLKTHRTFGSIENATAKYNHGITLETITPQIGDINVKYLSNIDPRIRQIESTYLSQYHGNATPIGFGINDGNFFENHRPKNGGTYMIKC
ncbi:uncharacterized protein LOC128388367 isoform X2 [Panonychus citri]|uniref:uncharacterized protein LOC128388367 isoform X2 n=1 Tax=Panonychus citri TaxID=50023 RepID=UPI0023071328|nr:uncharacterized protein LOC128388367 isoform X2 [Panonychus citri]